MSVMGSVGRCVIRRISRDEEEEDDDLELADDDDDDDGLGGVGVVQQDRDERIITLKSSTTGESWWIMTPKWFQL